MWTTQTEANVLILEQWRFEDKLDVCCGNNTSAVSQDFANFPRIFFRIAMFLTCDQAVVCKIAFLEVSNLSFITWWISVSRGLPKPSCLLIPLAVFLSSFGLFLFELFLYEKKFLMIMLFLELWDVCRTSEFCLPQLKNAYLMNLMCGQEGFRTSSTHPFFYFFDRWSFEQFLIFVVFVYVLPKSFTHAIINEMLQKQYFVSQHSWISRPLDQFSRFRSITSI